MSLKKDIISAEFRTTGANKLQHDIGATQGEIKRLNKENEMLLINKKKLEAQGKKDTEGWKQLTAEINKNNAAIKDESVKLVELKGKLKLTDMSARQLLVEKRKLTRELNKTSKALNPKKWKKLNGELVAVTTQYDKVRVGGRGVNSVMKKMGALLPVVGFAALVASAKRLISNIIEVRKEYEKYAAVLKVSLGSQKAARKEMGMLTKFAAETPFQLDQLTGSFVKLVNQGFKPSREELRKLGDLSASTGKDFDMLTEAIIDAQTGEFERLKEFGIRASKQGDQVKFTFKEMETQVGFTASEIRKYILGLGEMEGVSGSMAAISETLGGRISNMGDAWDQLMNTMGSRSSGIMMSVINWSIDLINGLQKSLKSIKEIKEEVMDDLNTQNLQSALQEIDDIAQSMMKRGIDQAEAEKRAVELYTQSVDFRITETKRALAVAAVDEQEFLQKKLDLLVNEREAVADHFYQVVQMEKKDREAYLIQQKKEQEEKKKTEEERLKKQAEGRESAKKLQLEMNAILYEEELKQLNEQLLKKEILQEEYEAKVIEAKIASLELELEIRRQAGEDITAIENQILDMQIQYREKLEAQLDKIDENRKKKREKDAVDEKKLAEEQWAAEVEAYNKKVVFFSGVAAELGQAMAEAIASGDADMQDILRKSLLVALKYLRDFARAKILTLSMASIDSVATGGIAGIAKAAALTLLVESAYGVAKAALTKKSDSSNYFAGGSTGLGGKYEPAGIVHRNEYVIPEEGFFNPSLRPFLNMIEEARKAGKLRSLNMHQPASRGFAEGGPTTQMIPQAAGTDPKMISLLEANISFLNYLQTNGVIAYIGDPQTRDIRDRIRVIEGIESSVSKA